MHPPVIFNEKTCIACNICVEVCPTDIFAPNPESCRPPLVVYPEECRYCGACWMRCPARKKNALTIVVPPAMRVSILRGAHA